MNSNMLTTSDSMSRDTKIEVTFMFTILFDVEPYIKTNVGRLLTSHLSLNFFWSFFKQLEEHLVNNELMDVIQSVYQAKYSMETALLKVQSNILSSLNEKGSVVVLVLLNLSAAFDTSDHAWFLSRLSDMYGIHDQALAWIRSCLLEASDAHTLNLYHI